MFPSPFLPHRPDDRGQATTEYGLVLLLAGTVALGLIVWARETGAIADLFENVIGRLTGGI
jgi:Flp pilus assembly pilin Flp